MSTQPLTADDVIDVRFHPTKFRWGYDQRQVDDFLDRVIDALRPVAERQLPTVLTRQEVQDVTFRATRWREGYDQDEVDALLERVRESLPI